MRIGSNAIEKYHAKIANEDDYYVCESFSSRRNLFTICDLDEQFEDDVLCIVDSCDQGICDLPLIRSRKGWIMQSIWY